MCSFGLLTVHIGRLTKEICLGEGCRVKGVVRLLFCREENCLSFGCKEEKIFLRLIEWSSTTSMALQQITEDRKMFNAMQVSFATGDWTVIVQVVEKHKADESKNKTTRFQKYVLTDMEGTRIAAVTFNSNIEPLEKLLIPFKRYKVANADLKVSQPRYRIGEYAYEWILTT